MRSCVLSWLVLTILVAVPAETQNVNPGHPDEISAQHRPTPDEMRSRLAKVQVQNDAKELSELCASVPGDMDSLKQGLLPAGTVEKLKRMEKLSKRLREELTR
jgi:hypothetical protein